MLPASTVISRGRRLTLAEFQAEFGAAWARMRTRFLKLETWQVYEEQAANLSQEAFRGGDVHRARELLRAEADGDRPLYEDVKRRNLDYARIRLIKEPLTDYLRYELLSYQIRAGMGENIVVVRVDRQLALPSPDAFDLLLFDRDTALVHDYGTAEVGSQTGGWLLRGPDVVEVLERVALSFRAQAIPLSEYLAELEGLD